LVAGIKGGEIETIKKKQQLRRNRIIPEHDEDCYDNLSQGALDELILGVMEKRKEGRRSRHPPLRTKNVGIGAPRQ